jgi:hypothetical protein
VELCEKQLAAARLPVVRQDLLFVADMDPDFPVTPAAEGRSLDLG